MSWQDGAILFGNTYSVPQEKYIQKPYDKSFIDQACEVQETGYGRHSLFFACLWTSTPSQFMNMQKKNLANISILTLRLVNNPYVNTLSIVILSHQNDLF